jgi:hypothetical protein
MGASREVVDAVRSAQERHGYTVCYQHEPAGRWCCRCGWHAPLTLHAAHPDLTEHIATAVADAASEALRGGA